MMLLSQVASVSRQVAATRSRLEKRRLLAGLWENASPTSIRIAVSYLTGILPQGRIGLGPAALRGINLGAATAPDAPGPELAAVNALFDAIAAASGKGATGRKRELFEDLLESTAAEDREFLVRLVLGELRQGALEAVILDSIADATGIEAQEIRRAAMLCADPAEVASTAFTSGLAGLREFRLVAMSPVRPMLAQPADSVATASAAIPDAFVDFKLDGARVQIHRDGDDVRVFSRQLNDVTASLPEVVDAVLELDAATLVFDGEVIALKDDGRPQPFQVTMRRFGRKAASDAMRRELPLSVFLFDCLLVNDRILIDQPLEERVAELEAIAPANLRVPRTRAGSAEAAAAFLSRALAAGHEGVMIKAPLSLYAAGSRGAEWLKVKHVHTLDLVVLAAEWGSGRRRGWLSNLHLGARTADGFVMLGKTFKGLTDKLLAWQTEALLAREQSREGQVVHVRPELVVEIAVNEIQASPHYPAGMALRFARVKRYRDDKLPEEADSIDTVRALFELQDFS